MGGFVRRAMAIGGREVEESIIHPISSIDQSLSMPVPRSIVLTMVTCGVLVGQVSPEWRFLDLSDGMTESFIRNITIGADGRAWIRHSGSATLTVFDGRRGVRVTASED